MYVAAAIYFYSFVLSFFLSFPPPLFSFIACSLSYLFSQFLFFCLPSLHIFLYANPLLFLLPSAVTRKTRLLGVVYNASNNELVRTNTLVKNCVIQIDATPFRQWYEQHYGVTLGTKKTKAPAAAAPAAAAAAAKKDDKPAAPAAAPADAAAKPAAATPAAAEEGPKKQSDHLKRKLSKRLKTRVVDHALEDQFTTGRLYAVISSRPGQSGRADGYVLEGRELEFYLKKINEKKGKKGGKE